MSASTELFRAAMAEKGLVCSDEIVGDGTIKRFYNAGDKKGSYNAWYVLYPDERPAGAFGTWKGGEKHTWSSAAGARHMTLPERQEWEARIAAQRAQREEEEHQRHAAAAARANAMWDAASEIAVADHPYVKRKQVTPYGARVGDWVRELPLDDEIGGVRVCRTPNTLLIPICNSTGEIVTLQAIFAEPINGRDKRYLTGGEKRGGFLAIGDPAAIDGKTTVVICEGWATGCSIHEATGLAVRVAFDAGGLAPVALAARQAHPDALIVIAADNDAWNTRPDGSPWNPGVEKANEAAASVGGALAVPSFTKVSSKPTDFNDLQACAGLEQVRIQIMNAIKQAPIEQGRTVVAADLCSGKSAPERPVIKIVEGDLAGMVDQAEAALLKSGFPVYQRAETLVEVCPPVPGQPGGCRIMPIGLNRLIEMFTEAARFVKFDDRRRVGQELVTKDCPKNVAATYIEKTGHWRLPPLLRVISTPTLREDGSILDRPGYDQRTGLFYDPQGIDYGQIPEYPTKEEALEALRKIRPLIDTFPYIDGPSSSVALSAILTSLVRPSLRTAPLHGFTAPVAGSGKSTLVDIASVIAHGTEAAVMSQGLCDEELAKRLAAALIEGRPSIAIDNIDRGLGGDLLCQMLTQVHVTARVLGHSKNVTVPTNTSLFATGNNLILVGDMSRRTLICSLDPKCERPELQTFSFDPVTEAKRGRRDYVRAGLTILRAFQAAGRPTQNKPLGSFEAWSRLVRDALTWLGEADPLESMERARATDPKLQTHSAMIAQWREVIGVDRRVTAKELVDAATAHKESSGLDLLCHSDLQDALLSVAGDKGMINNRRLGNWLNSVAGRIVEGFRIVRDGMRSGTVLYALKRA